MGDPLAKKSTLVTATLLVTLAVTAIVVGAVNVDPAEGLEIATVGGVIAAQLVSALNTFRRPFVVTSPFSDEIASTLFRRADLSWVVGNVHLERTSAAAPAT